MKVFLFDLIAYGAHFEDAKAAKLLPYPLPGHRFDPEVGARTFEEHLEAWAEMDRLGFDGVGLNEHHTTAHSLMNSPNMMAAAGAQRTKNLKFLLLGNLLPLHNPLRIAEELAMADCLSRGRILSGFARGVPREYGVYGVPMAESRARFEEAVDIILKAWTEDVFSYEGKFWSYKDISIWPRPYARPYPPVWVPFMAARKRSSGPASMISAPSFRHSSAACSKTSPAISPRPRRGTVIVSRPINSACSQMST
jgi:Luciferase-like monooxygenase